MGSGVADIRVGCLELVFLVLCYTDWTMFLCNGQCEHRGGRAYDKN